MLYLNAKFPKKNSIYLQISKPSSHDPKKDHVFAALNLQNLRKSKPHAIIFNFKFLCLFYLLIFEVCLTIGHFILGYLENLPICLGNFHGRFVCSFSHRHKFTLSIPWGNIAEIIFSLFFHKREIKMANNENDKTPGKTKLQSTRKNKMTEHILFMIFTKKTICEFPEVNSPFTMRTVTLTI